MYRKPDGTQILASDLEQVERFNDPPRDLWKTPTDTTKFKNNDCSDATAAPDKHSFFLPRVKKSIGESH